MSAEPVAVPGRFLAQLLGQSEQIRQLIEHAAEELASVKPAIALEFAKSGAPPGVEVAFDKAEAVANQLLDASGRLLRFEQALSSEIRERSMVDHQLAAALEQEQGSRNAALHDNLTGLPNRVLFRDRLEHAIAQAIRRRWILAVMFVDLDNFKGINDTHGHQAGDAVLQTVAMRLTHNTRRDDTVSRYGGDEFLYLLAQLHDENDITAIAEKLLKAIHAPCEVTVGEAIVTLCLRASIGISFFPTDGATADALIERADRAMYVAKQGKSGFALAE